MPGWFDENGITGYQPIQQPQGQPGAELGAAAPQQQAAPPRQFDLAGAQVHGRNADPKDANDLLWLASQQPGFDISSNAAAKQTFADIIQPMFAQQGMNPTLGGRNLDRISLPGGRTIDFIGNAGAADTSKRRMWTGDSALGGGGGNAAPQGSLAGIGQFGAPVSPDLYRPPTGAPSDLGAPGMGVSLPSAQPQQEQLLAMAAKAQQPMGQPYAPQMMQGPQAMRIPGFAAGVQNFSGGPALVGERAPEWLNTPQGGGLVGTQGPQLLNLPQGSDVIPMGGMTPMTMGGLGGNWAGNFGGGGGGNLADYANVGQPQAALGPRPGSQNLSDYGAGMPQIGGEVGVNGGGLQDATGAPQGPINFGGGSMPLPQIGTPNGGGNRMAGPMSDGGTQAAWTGPGPAPWAAQAPQGVPQVAPDLASAYNPMAAPTAYNPAAIQGPDRLSLGSIGNPGAVNAQQVGPGQQVNAGTVQTGQSVAGAQAAQGPQVFAGQVGQGQQVNAGQVGPGQQVGAQQVAPGQQVAAERIRAQSVQTPAQIGAERVTGPAALQAQQLGPAQEQRNLSAAQLQLDPSYQFRRDETQRALENSAWSKGMGFHPNAIRGQMDAAGQLASQEYAAANARNLGVQQQNFQNQGTVAGANNAANAQAYGLTNQFQQQAALANQATGLEAGKFNVGTNLQAGMFNASQQQSADQFNAANQMQSGQFNSAQGQQAALANQSANLQAGQFNSAQGQQSALANQGVNLQASQFNSSQGQQAALANQGANLQAGQFNASQGQQNAQFNAANAQQAGMFNSGQQQQANLANVGNQLQAGQFNSGQGQQAALANQGANLQAGQFNANQNFQTQQANIGNQLAAYNAYQPLAQQNQQFNAAQNTAAQQNNFANQFSVNQANNAGSLGAFNANLGAELGRGQLSLGNRSADQSFQLGQGNLANQAGQLQLGNRSADQSYDLGLRNNQLGWYGAQTSAANQAGHLGVAQGQLGLQGQNQQYNQDANTFNTNYGVFRDNRDTAFSQATTLAGIGANAAGNYGNQAGALYSGQGNANGAAAIAQGNAWGGALGTIGNIAGDAAQYYGTQPQQPYANTGGAIPWRNG